MGSARTVSIAFSCAVVLVHARGSAITFGTTTTGDPAVVAIGVHDPCNPESSTVGCTGTLVSPRVVVTAAHCLDVPSDLVRVFAGADLATAGDGLRASLVKKHEAFDPKTYANDVGVVVLAEPLGVAPIPMQLDALEAGIVGTKVRIVGYGIPEEGAGAPGLKRTGTSVIARLDATTFRIEPSPSMSCQLDSGGPVFLQVAGREVLAGITSNGDRFCMEYGDNTRVDVFAASFVQPVIEAAAVPGALPAPPPRECPKVDDCTIDGCAAGLECNRLTGRCERPALPSLRVGGGGCTYGDASNEAHGGVLAIATAMVMQCVASRRTRPRRSTPSRR